MQFTSGHNSLFHWETATLLRTRGTHTLAGSARECSKPFRGALRKEEPGCRADDRRECRSMRSNTKTVSLTRSHWDQSGTVLIQSVR